MERRSTKTSMEEPMKQVIKDKNGNVTKVVTVFDPENRPSKTRQEFKNECDINQIIKKYNRTGELTHLKKNNGVFMDHTKLGDYQENLNKIIEANNAFNALNSQTRSRFKNDPNELIQFLNNKDNYDEAVKLGLLVPRKDPQPDPVLTELKDLNKKLSNPK